MKSQMKLAALFLSALMLGACGNKNAEENKKEEKPKVKIEKVIMQDVPQEETFTATVESDVKNNIAPNTPYRIEKIYVDVGDQVKKGQVVVQLDASNLKQMGLQVENLRVEFKRTDELYKVGGASKSEWDNAKTQLDVNETQYKQLLQNTRLTSPISGVVTARNYDDGDMYSSASPVLTIEQLNPVKLLFNISETYFKQVKRGMPVAITLDAYEGEAFEGKVSIVYPTIDASTHTFPVEVTINNADQKVRPGMFARASINFGTINRVMVPDESIVKQVGAGDRYVYVYKNGKVSYNKVVLGRHIGTKYEIVSGVEPGSTVVTAGMSRLANGVAVDVVK